MAEMIMMVKVRGKRIRKQRNCRYSVRLEYWRSVMKLLKNGGFLTLVISWWQPATQKRQRSVYTKVPVMQMTILQNTTRLPRGSLQISRDGF